MVVAWVWQGFARNWCFYNGFSRVLVERTAFTVGLARCGFGERLTGHGNVVNQVGVRFYRYLAGLGPPPLGV